MADNKEDVISKLNNLIETCKDGEQGFRDAADGVERSDLKAIFNECCRQRAQFASELQMQVSRMGGEPEMSGSMGGSLHRGWINLKSALTGKDDHAILAECERGEDSAVKNYEDAMEADLPANLQAIIEQQYDAVLSSHNRMRALRDSSSGQGEEEMRSSTRDSTMKEYSDRRTY